MTGLLRKHGFPFICPSIPFIGHKSSIIMPSICQKQPLVWNSGFTLIELIITLTIAGILAVIAVPNLQTFVLNNRLTAQTNDFIADLNFARSEAIKRAANIGVCAGTTTGCSGGTTWSGGRIVFVDLNNNSSWDATDQILRVRETLTGNNTLRDTSGGTNKIIFIGTGFATSGAATYSLCDSRGASSGKAISVTSTGQIKSASPASAC